MTNDGTEGDKTLRSLNNDENMRFWRNGFDFSPLPESKEELRKQLDLQDDVYYTVSVCRLAKWKRCERIVEAYKNIGIPSEKIKHIFVGDGEERENLENMIRSYGLDDYFVFCGSQPHEKVKEYLQASDTFLSFFDSTNSGNPLIEAVKINLPIVTYDVGDTGTVIVDGENGIMLEEPDPEKIAREIEALVSDESLRNKLIEGTKNSSAMFYSWETRVENELNELKRLAR
jgi:glycosyltransferase involved in cell wall biosynthesis